MNNSIRILVASPTYEGMKYCEKEFLTRLKELDYPNYNILIIDNSKEDDYFNHLKEDYANMILIRDDSNEQKNILRLISSRNKILDYAIKNNYDYILMLDSDIIPPKNILKELLNCNKDLISGLYYNYFKVNNQFKWLPVAWTALTEAEFKELKQKISLPSFIKSNLDLRAQLTEKEANSNELIEVLIPSAGCMLINKKVFLRIKYRLVDTDKYNSLQTTDDIYFILEARKLGFNVYCNTKIKCKHLIQGKFEKDSEDYSNHPIYD